MKMLTAKDIAKIMKISYHKSLEFIRYSGIDYIKIGSHYRVSEDKFISFINAKGNRIV